MYCILAIGESSSENRSTRRRNDLDTESNLGKLTPADEGNGNLLSVGVRWLSSAFCLF